MCDDLSFLFLFQCSLLCISQQWSQSAQACDCLTLSSTLPLMKQPNHKQSWQWCGGGAVALKQGVVLKPARAVVALSGLN